MNQYKKTIGLTFLSLALLLNLAFATVSFAQTPGVGVNTSTTTTTGKTETPATAPVDKTGIGQAIRTVGDKTSLPNYDAGHTQQNYHPGASQITSIVYFGLDVLKYILGAIAVIMMVIAGFNLVISGKKVAETLKEQQGTITSIAIGLVIVLISDEVIRNVFFGEEGEVYRTQTDLIAAAERSNQLMDGVVNLMLIFIPALAVLFIVIAGVRMIAAQGDAAAINKAKKQIAWTIAGLIVAGIAELIVYVIFYPDQGSSLPDTQQLAQFVVTATNYISGFMSTIAVLFIIYAGYLYTISMGGEDSGNAKKILTGAIVGLLIAMAAFGLVNTFVRLDPPQNLAAEQKPVVP